MRNSLQTMMKPSLHCDEELHKSNSAQAWVTKTVNQDFFADSHLLTMQERASECYVKGAVYSGQ